MGIVPLAAIAFISAWHSRLRILSLTVCVALTLVFLLNLNQLRDHAAWLYFIQHAGAMTLLGVTFGVTLLSRHEDALCSRIASFAHRDVLDAEYARYTWLVTLAWTSYFAASALLSVLLFFVGPIEVWSVFANILTPILLGAMFAGEYLIRTRVMPDRPHFNISETIAAYREYSSQQKHN